MKPIVIIAACVLSGCASLGSRLNRSADLPKAKAVVRYAKAPDTGTRIDLRAKGMTDPEALTPPGYLYVAWVQSDRETPPQNVGPLVLNKKTSERELRAATPLKNFELFVTAEASSDVERPSGPPVLWTASDLGNSRGSD